MSVSGQASSAFERLHPSVQRWVWRQGWTELRDLQERAVPAVLDGERDVILAAATASGKTEAAFLPVLSRLAEEDSRVPGFRVLYVSPLKALINDQFGRLRLMGEAAGVPVHRWHGDVPQSRKAAALRNPDGVLLITPESLEALFVRRGLELPGWFAPLAYVVVDELHAFIGTERGRQLQSLLHRVDLATRRTRPRIALSATLGDMRMAADFLRPGGGADTLIVESEAGSAELRLQVRGYRARASTDGKTPTPTEEIAAHLFQHLRGTDNLVFANSRNRVEELSDRLRRLSEESRVPLEFFPHHGNLSKSLREELEAALKADRPVTAVCTSTLELGVDIGSVHSVAQVGPPHSVASLRQRLGRSGRREGEAAVLRLYVTEPELDRDARPDEGLRLRLVQAVAMVELLLRRWYEPPRTEALHLSTLVQQVLSVIVQHGGARADQLFGVLCRSGPFRTVDGETFAQLLRQLGAEGVLQQSTDGTLLLGPTGERIVGHYSFYAAFQSDEEYRLVHAGRGLGTLPVEHAVAPGMHLVFAGKRWRVLDVDANAHRIAVEPSPTGKVPTFGGGGGLLDGHVVRTMYEVLAAEDTPAYLGLEARSLLEEGRRQFADLGLRDRWAVPAGGQTLLFPWVGGAALNALALALTAEGISVEPDRVHLVVDAPPDEVLSRLHALAEASAPSPHVLAAEGAREREKHHGLLDRSLLCADYASSQLDLVEAWTWLEDLQRARAPST